MTGRPLAIVLAGLRLAALRTSLPMPVEGRRRRPFSSPAKPGLQADAAESAKVDADALDRARVGGEQKAAPVGRVERSVRPLPGCANPGARSRREVTATVDPENLLEGRAAQRDIHVVHRHTAGQGRSGCDAVVVSRTP